ncbi:ribonuclease H [Pontibacillus halophilus JSM 076056 = DSM 19796]|uniref:Ribonuclease H n=2 Tax=Pontibacillus TaxID=289201 RepID=A0A0A5I7X5_9BACI|nr:ribonuclease HI family protein [Pontibacillus halophilus]KGX91937.1 ribonuclease H [Pontibacillus halophilus JSM 076056 = DSM 19796]
MIEVYTDGAAKGDPGPSGAGIYIKNGRDYHSLSIPLGNMSNHEAEFHAVIHALDYCRQHYPDEIISVRSDSKLVVQSVEKSFCKQERFRPLLQQVETLGAQFPYFFIKWIPEKQNKQADELSRAALQKPKG